MTSIIPHFFMSSRPDERVIEEMIFNNSRQWMKDRELILQEKYLNHRILIEEIERAIKLLETSASFYASLVRLNQNNELPPFEILSVIAMEFFLQNGFEISATNMYSPDLAATKFDSRIPVNFQNYIFVHNQPRLQFFNFHAKVSNSNMTLDVEVRRKEISGFVMFIVVLMTRVTRTAENSNLPILCINVEETTMMDIRFSDRFKEKSIRTIDYVLKKMNSFNQKISEILKTKSDGV